jgi:hypothetical protein
MTQTQSAPTSIARRRLPGSDPVQRAGVALADLTQSVVVEIEEDGMPFVSVGTKAHRRAADMPMALDNVRSRVTETSRMLRRVRECASRQGRARSLHGFPAMSAAGRPTPP